MEKTTIAMNLAGVLVDKEPWKNAHKLWFEDIAKKLERPDIAHWADIYTQEDEYFSKVIEATNLQYPNLLEEEQIIKAREIFYNYVLEYIKKNPQVIYQDSIDKIKEHKDKFTFVLISSTPKEKIDEMLKILNIQNLFDMIKTSSLNQKDNRTQLYDSYVKEFGKPAYYIEKKENLLKILK
jgi:FMN phosphatase YigB (HAD superfamily)